MSSSSTSRGMLAALVIAAGVAACAPPEGEPESGGNGAGVELVDSPLLASGCAQLTPNHTGQLISSTTPQPYPDRYYNSAYGFPTNRSGCGYFYSAKATKNHWLWGGLRVYITAVDTELDRYCSSPSVRGITYAAYEIWSRTSYSGVWKRLKYQDQLPACGGLPLLNWTWKDTCVWEPSGENCVAWDFGEDYVVTVKLYRLGTNTPITDVRLFTQVTTSFGFL